MKYRLLLILGLVCTLAQAQENLDSLWKVLVPQKKRAYIFAEGSIGAQSSYTSTSDVLRVLGDDFLDADEKENLIPGSGRLRLGYIRTGEVGYRQPGYKIFDAYRNGQGFSISNTYYSSAGLSNDMARLILFGNKQAAGETMDLDKSKIESWYYSNLKYHFDVVIDSTLPISLTAGIVLGHDHSFYALQTAQLFTAEDGEYLDLDLDYRYRETLNSSVLSGLGVAFGAEANFKTGAKSALNVKIDDLGLISFSQGRSLNTDSTFRFRGIALSNVLEVNDSLLSLIEDDYQETYYYQRQGNITRLMPFSVDLTQRWLTGNTSFPQIFASARYLHLAGYFPKLSLGGQWQISRNHQLQASVSGGGFYTAGLDAGYRWDIGRYWQFRMQVINLSGLIVPSLPGGAVVSGSLRYEL